MKIRNKAIPAVYIFLEKDGKFLIARRCNTGYEDGNYQVPAGHVDEGELPTEAIIRETKEEVGVSLKPQDLELFHISYRIKHDNTDNRVDFFFKTKNWDGEIKNMEPHKCDDLTWAGIDELPKNMTAHILVGFKALQEGLFFKELGTDFFKEKGLYKLQ